MFLYVTSVLALALWVLLWAIGVKAFDAGMLTLLIILGAAGARIVSPHLPGNRSDDS